MKLVVDLTRCQGYAQCAFLAPDAFTMHGDGEALLYDPEPSDELRERVLRAAAARPVQAIVLDRGPRAGGSPGAGPAAARRGDMDEEFLKTGRIVIVGASLAGTRGAGALRYPGFTGPPTRDGGGGRGGAALPGVHRLADRDRRRVRRPLRPAAAVQAGAGGPGAGGAHRAAA